MALQQHFSLKRFYEYLVFDILSNLKKYLIFIGVLVIVLLLIDFLAIEKGSSFRTTENGLTEYFFRINTYQVLYVSAFLITIVLAVGSSFSALRKKDSTTSYLLLPASILEKYLVEFLLRIVVFSLLFTFIFWIDFKLAASLYNFLNLEYFTEIPNFGFFDIFPKNMNPLDRKVISLSMLSFASFLFASATFFKKNVILKMVLLVGVFGLATFLFSVLLSHLFLPNEVSGFQVRVFDRFLENRLNTIQLCIYVIGTFSSLFLLPLGYFKLKEKQV
jgi:hypothetical protein